MPRQIRLIYANTSRCSPTQPGGLHEYLEARPGQPPFHAWMAVDGHIIQCRGKDDLIMPDPGIWFPPTAWMWVLCVAGRYHSSKARSEGGAPNPEQRTLDALRVFLKSQLVELELPDTALCGPWDFGHHAWAGDDIEWLVRTMRGEKEPMLPSDEYENFPPQLLSVQQRRDAMRELKFPTGDEPNGVWTVADQVGLVAMQAKLGLEPTGWWDAATIMATREALNPNGASLFHRRNRDAGKDMP